MIVQFFGARKPGVPNWKAGAACCRGIARSPWRPDGAGRRFSDTPPFLFFAYHENSPYPHPLSPGKVAHSGRRAGRFPVPAGDLVVALGVPPVLGVHAVRPAVLPRSRARGAGGRGPGAVPGRRPHRLRRGRGRSLRGRAPGAEDQRLHERLQRALEPRPRGRRGAVHQYFPASSSTPPWTRRRWKTNATPWCCARRTARRSRPCRSPAWWPSASCATRGPDRPCTQGSATASSASDRGWTYTYPRNPSQGRPGRQGQGHPHGPGRTARRVAHR